MLALRASSHGVSNDCRVLSLPHNVSLPSALARHIVDLCSRLLEFDQRKPLPLCVP